MTITLNTIASFFRKQNREQEIFKSEDGYEVYGENILTENNCMLTLTMDDIMEIVNAFGPEVALIFSLVHQGYKRKEIAEKIGKPLEEIHAIIDKCRKKLDKWRKDNY